jgi:hypothetical protein
MIRSLFSRMAIKNGVSIKGRMWLTKYVVGAKANPPKNPRRAPKKGKVMATNIVNAATEKNMFYQLMFNPTSGLSSHNLGRWKAGVLLTHIYIA